VRRDNIRPDIAKGGSDRGWLFRLGRRWAYRSAGPGEEAAFSVEVCAPSAPCKGLTDRVGKTVLVRSEPHPGRSGRSSCFFARRRRRSVARRCLPGPVAVPVEAIIRRRIVALSDKLDTWQASPPAASINIAFVNTTTTITQPEPTHTTTAPPATTSGRDRSCQRRRL